MEAQIVLRALTLSDLPLTLSWHNQEDIVDLYSGHPFPVNKEMEKLWYDRILTSNYPVTVFGIEVVETLALIGISVLKDIDLLNRSAETAIYIGDDKYRGRGYSKLALDKTLDFGFNKLGLNRIWLKVRQDNSRAIRLYESAGFRLEGTLREALFKNGSFVSVSVYSILNQEYIPMV